MAVQDQINNLKDDLAALRASVTAWKEDQAAKIADLKATYLARLDDQAAKVADLKATYQTRFDDQRDKLAVVKTDLATARRQLSQTRKVLIAAARRVRTHHNECTCNCSW